MQMQKLRPGYPGSGGNARVLYMVIGYGRVF